MSNNNRKKENQTLENLNLGLKERKALNWCNESEGLMPNGGRKTVAASMDLNFCKKNHKINQKIEIKNNLTTTKKQSKSNLIKKEDTKLNWEFPTWNPNQRKWIWLLCIEENKQGICVEINFYM